MLDVAADPQAEVAIDLHEQTLDSAAGLWSFAFDQFTKQLLLEGLDDIAMTLQHADAITAFEATRPTWMPVTTP